MSEEELQHVLEQQQQLMYAQQYQQQMQMQQFIKQQQTSITKKSGNSLRPKSAKTAITNSKAIKPKGITQSYANFYQPYAAGPGLKKKSTLTSQSVGALKAAKGKKKKKRAPQTAQQMMMQ